MNTYWVDIGTFRYKVHGDTTTHAKIQAAIEHKKAGRSTAKVKDIVKYLVFDVKRIT